MIGSNAYMQIKCKLIWEYTQFKQNINRNNIDFFKDIFWFFYKFEPPGDKRATIKLPQTNWSESEAFGSPGGPRGSQTVSLRVWESVPAITSSRLDPFAQMWISSELTADRKLA